MRLAQQLSVLGGVLLLGCAAAAVAQPLPPPLPTLPKNPYVDVLYGFLVDWDQKKLQLPAKATLTSDFETRLDERVRVRPLGYETPVWKDLTYSRWKSLPTDVGPQLPLSEGGKLAIVAGYVDNIPQFKFPATRDAVWRESRIGLFAVLSLSQAKALERKQSNINATEVQEAIVSMLTSVYPFCVVLRP